LNQKCCIIEFALMKMFGCWKWDLPVCSGSPGWWSH